MLAALTTGRLVIQSRQLHLTQPLAKKVAGKFRTTVRRTRPLTYEQSQKPDYIGVRKSWNSINANNMDTSIRHAATAQEDVFIRKFVHGVWPELLASEIIIKRRANRIILNPFIVRKTSSSKMSFLIGFTEESLSLILKCDVKVEPQTIDDASDLTYKYV